MVVGGAGGVGSILIQLARQLTKLRVIATASRPESREWCLELGAHAVIDHSKPLSQALRSAGIEHVDYVASLTQTPAHYQEIIESLKPQGAGRHRRHERTGSRRPQVQVAVAALGADVHALDVRDG